MKSTRNLIVIVAALQLVLPTDLHADTLHVWPGSPAPGSPYNSWTNAANCVGTPSCTKLKMIRQPRDNASQDRNETALDSDSGGQGQDGEVDSQKLAHSPPLLEAD